MESMRSTGHDAKYRIDAVGAIPILIFVLLAILLKMFGLDNAFVYEPPDLLTILNTIFLFGCPLLVVYIAAKGYLASGSTSLMTLESGVLSFAVGSLIAGFMLPWKGPNGVITLHNCSVLLAGLLHLFGAASALAGARMEQDVHGRASRLFLVNAGILILMFLLTFGAVQEKLPVFFVQGQGPTLLRQIVLGTAIFSFLISGFLFLKLYSDSRSRFFYWYAMALFLITIGLFCVFIQKSFGDPIGWLGRTAQYLAGLYLIAGVFRGARELDLGVLRMDNILAKLFRSRFEKLLEERTEQLSLVNDELCKENERRRQSEELLRLEKAILSRTERLAHVGSWEWDIATDTVTWSDELFRIFQRDPQEGAPSLAEHPAFYHPDDMARLQKAVEAAVAEGTPYELELRAIRKDGMTRVCKVYGVAEKGQVGRAIRLFGSHQDITEQKQAEEALNESKKHYRSLVEGTPGIVYSFSSKRGSVYFSSRVIDILGYSPEQLYAQPMLWHNSIHPDDLPYVNQIIREVTTSKPFCIEYRIQDAHGDWHWFEDRSTGYHIDGTDVIMEGLALDITDSKRAEVEKAQLEAQNRQLQKVESLGRMAGAIAHHFNNQLYAVMGNLEMVMDDLPLGVNSNESLVSAMQAARKAADVSRLMLTYIGQTPGNQEPIDLSETCRQSLTLLQAATPKGIIINAEFPASGPVIRADTNQMHQILTNLVTNAWESISDSRGIIDLIVKTVSHVDIPTVKRFPIDWQPQSIPYACLEVSDTGCGIADKCIEKLFDPFFTTKFTGRGLGLSVVMGIVKAHGGGVTVESEPGRGSVFRVFLPVLTEEFPIQHDLPVISVALQAGKAENISKIEGGGTMLLIDDDQQVRRMAKIMLTRLGYQVIEAQDGVEALELFQQHQDDIHCVLSDLTMPRMNGWETLAALRKLSPDIPVILSSGYDEAKVMAEEHTEIPNAFLGKPYQLKGLRDTINRVLTAPAGNNGQLETTN